MKMDALAFESSDIVQEELRHAGESTAPVFQDISADDSDLAPTEIESLCMQCSRMGKTRLMLTRVPFFKELVVGSFDCEHCGFTDSEITSAGKIQEKGVTIALQVSAKDDLNRQLVKSDSAVVKIPHVALEIPAKKGCFTTIEGIINTTCEELSYGQPARRLIEPETAVKIDEFIDKLKLMLLVQEPFQFILDDPAGNSHIENPRAPSIDPLLHTLRYTRTKAQDEALGIQAAEPGEEAQTAAAEPQLSKAPLPGEPGVPPIEFSDEVLQFDTNCTQCNAPAKTNMKLVNIPRFKQVIIMALVCDACGYKNNEVKPGGGIAERGQCLTLTLREPIDLNRDVLKSETASVSLPDLDVFMVGTSVGGFTTVEGLISQLADQLRRTDFTFTGDSASSENHQRIETLCDELSRVKSGERLGVKVVIDDPAGNSYIQDIYEPEEDPCLASEIYTRTAEQDDELGLLSSTQE